MRRLLIFFPVFLLAIISYGQEVYKTPSGKKYHLANCRTVKNVSEKISIEKALELGLEPCQVCHPPVVDGGDDSGKNKQQGQSGTVQCKGMTKAGTRCKHKTSIGNGYCFQHQLRR